MVPQNFIGELTEKEYHSFRYISKGTYGSVWKGQVSDNDTIFAIKFFKYEDEYKEELEAHKLLKERYIGDKIVKMVDYCEDALVVVMDYISGSVLDKISFMFGNRLDANKIKLFLSMFKQTLEILDKLDQSGLIHADIKPANIIVTQDYQVYLVDIGLLRIQKNRDERKYSRWWRSIGAMYGYATHEDDVFATLICYISLLVPQFYRNIKASNSRRQYFVWLNYIDENVLKFLSKHFKEREIMDDINELIYQDVFSNIGCNNYETLDKLSDKVWERVGSEVETELVYQLRCFWNIAIDFMKPITAREILNILDASTKEVPDESMPVIIENDNILSDSNSPKIFCWKDVLKINKGLFQTIYSKK